MKFKIGEIATFKLEEWINKNTEKCGPLAYKYGRNNREFEFPFSPFNKEFEVKDIRFCEMCEINEILINFIESDGKVYKRFLPEDFFKEKPKQLELF